MAKLARGRIAAFTVLWRALRNGRRPGAPGIGAQLAAAPRMIKLGLSGRYPNLDGRRVGLAVLGLVYIVWPLDILPDFIPLLGLGDDAFVAAWIAGALLGETDRFLQWEAERDKVVVGQVIR
jgi:uncharacterized membrane protein YkvA (DUF1232 family)